MWNLLTLLLAGGMCLWRSFVYATAYDAETGLFTRGFMTFTLPNLITAVVVVAMLMMTMKPRTDAWKANKRGCPPAFIAMVAFAAAAVLKCVLLATAQQPMSVSGLITCATMVLLAFFAVGASAYQAGSTNKAGVAAFAMLCGVALLAMLVTTFIAETEMNVLEAYMYDILAISGGAMYMINVAKSLVGQGSMETAMWYGRITLYSTLVACLPKGISLLSAQSTVAGLGYLAAAVGCCALVLCTGESVGGTPTYGKRVRTVDEKTEN